MDIVDAITDEDAIFPEPGELVFVPFRFGATILGSDLSDDEEALISEGSYAVQDTLTWRTAPPG